MIGNATPRGASIAKSTAATGSYMRRQRRSPTRSATSTRSTRDIGRSGCAIRWTSNSRSGANSTIDGVGIGAR